MGIKTKGFRSLQWTAQAVRVRHQNCRAKVKNNIAVTPYISESNVKVLGDPDVDGRIILRWIFKGNQLSGPIKCGNLLNS
jgi:hypothetical protein